MYFMTTGPRHCCLNQKDSCDYLCVAEITIEFWSEEMFFSSLVWPSHENMVWKSYSVFFLSTLGHQMLNNSLPFFASFIVLPRGICSTLCELLLAQVDSFSRYVLNLSSLLFIFTYFHTCSAGFAYNMPLAASSRRSVNFSSQRKCLINPSTCISLIDKKKTN